MYKLRVPTAGASYKGLSGNSPQVQLLIMVEVVIWEFPSSAAANYGRGGYLGIPLKCSC